MSTVVSTNKVVLDRANPNELPDVLQKVKLGTMFTPVEYDSGTITATASPTIPGEGALLVQSARVVTSGTAASVGCYLAADSAATPFLPTAASERPGVAALAADGKSITFPNTVTRVLIRYVPKPQADLTAQFANS